MSKPSTLQIDLHSDIACPWCYIGEKRLRKALAERPHVEAKITWRAFELQPGLPPEGLPWQDFMAAKFGGAANLPRIFARVANAGAPDGIDFQFERVARAISTKDVQRLILWAQKTATDPQLGMQLADHFFAAHFTQGKNLNARADLTDVLSAAGIDVDAALAVIDSDAYKDDVRRDQAHAAELGISGVPFFVFDNRYALSGAQPAEAFVQIFDELRPGPAI
jgi:predicted DsbA family dithiol-disulfide isomerase